MHLVSRVSLFLRAAVVGCHSCHRAAGVSGATVAQCATIATSGMDVAVSQVLLLGWVLLVYSGDACHMHAVFAVSVMGVAGVSGGLLSSGPQVA